MLNDEEERSSKHSPHNFLDNYSGLLEVGLQKEKESEHIICRD